MHTGSGHETCNTALDTNAVEGKPQYKLGCLAGFQYLSMDNLYQMSTLKHLSGADHA